MSNRRNRVLKHFKKYFQDFNKYWLVFILVIFALGLYFRLTNLFNPGFIFDTIETQYTWAKNALEMGYGPFWRDYNNYFDYLPGAVGLGMILAAIGNIFNPIIPGEASQAFVTVMKVFNMLVDLGIAVACYYTARNYAGSSKEKSAFIAALCFAMPSFWFISNVWGQFDSFVVLLALLSVIIMYYRNKHGGHANVFRDLGFYSGVIFAIGFWLKPPIILVVPLILIYQFTSKPALLVKSAILNTFFWFLIFSGVVTIGVYLNLNATNPAPSIIALAGLFFFALIAYSFFISKKGFKPLTSLYRQGFGFWVGSLLIATIPFLYNPIKVIDMLRLPFTKEDSVTSGASTFWPLIGVTGDASKKLFEIGGFGPSVSLVGMLIFTLLMVFVYLRYQGINLDEIKSNRFNINSALERLLKRKLSFANFTLLMTILGSAYFLFMTKMHSRYLIWAIVFSFIALAAVSSRKSWKSWLIFLLIVHFGYFLNQLGVFNSWYQYLPWTIEFLQIFNFETGLLSSFLIYFGFLGFYLWIWRYSNPKGSLIEHVVE